MLEASTQLARLSAAQIAAALRSGVCPSDASFDAFLPDRLRAASARYWTPLVVAMRLARWLEPLGVECVVDIGSGAGKLAVAAALAGNARLIGLEHRARLVEAATALAQVFDVGHRVQFIRGSVSETPLPSADAYYLFNPFGENLYDEHEHLDGDVEVSRACYARDVAATEALLEDAPSETILVTYNGYGGAVPPSYREIRVNRHFPEPLRMWRKVPERRCPAAAPQEAS